MGKGGGKQHTPYEKRDNLKSTQELSVIDVVSEGPIEGPINGLQGLRLNDTPVIDAQGHVNVHGVRAEWRAGEEEQIPLTDFDGSAAETIISAEVTQDKPITRTITSENVDRLRVTVGLQALVRTTDQGDRLDDSVKMEIQIQRSGVWLTEKTIVINGKRTSPFMTAVIIDNLPPRPFNLRVVRITPDSTTDQLQNKTVWQGLTEIIKITQSYPNTALVGLKVDADQFGSQSVSRKFYLRGRIVRVPSNYDPSARTYEGLWDGSFKPAWTNNPAWQLLDLLAHPRYGLGQRIGLAEVDKWALYAIAQYCDQPVPNGFGGTEPRMTCNAYLAERRKAYDVISDFCSVMRCMPVWNGQRMTFTQDRPSDTVWTYTNANVVNGEFKYTYSAAKERHNAAEVRFVDPMNGWNVSVELVEDKTDIQKKGRQVVQIDAFGCTSRGQAHRTGLWVIQTALLETQMVAFSVGAEGLRHTPGDIIEVCDNDYAGVSVGGRLVAVDTAASTVTLDRDIQLPETGQSIMRFIGQDGQPQSASIMSQPSQRQVVLNPFPTGVITGSVWGLKTATLRRRLFRCLVIKEAEKGVYAITGLQHVPEKELIVDKGATFDLEEMKATEYSQTPPDVEHLTAQIDSATLGWQVVANWDTPRLIKGGRFQVKLLTQDIEPRLVSQTITTETSYTFRELTQGDYTLCVRAMNADGRYGEITQIPVAIHAPAAPVAVHVSSGYRSVTLTPRLPEITVTQTQFEFWFTGIAPLTAVGEVQSKGTYLGTGLSWTTPDLQVGTVYYWYVRSTSVLGKSNWVEVVATCETGADELLQDFTRKITKTQLGQDVLAEIDTKAIKDDVDAALNQVKVSIDVVAGDLSQESNARQAAFVQESVQRADALLLEQQRREMAVTQLSEQLKTAQETFSRQLSQVVAGTGEQFDAVKIWHFNQGTTEGWTANGGLATVTSDGALRPANHLLDPFVVSPSGLAIDAVAYRFVKFRVIRVGKSVWNGKLYWRAPGAAFSERCSQVLPVVIFDAHQSATVTLKDIPWAEEKTIESIRLDLSSQQTATDYFLIDWIAIGRPTPGAGLAALEAEQLARSQADAQEASQRQLLAAQLRGSYEGGDINFVSTGLIAEERKARIQADSAESSARETLKTQLNQSVSEINRSLSTLNTQNSAEANEMTAIKSSLQGKADNSALVSKADASALTQLQQQITQQGSVVSAQGSNMTALSNKVSVIDGTLSETDLLARALPNGKLVNQDPNFKVGVDSVSAYNNTGNGNITVSRIVRQADNPSSSSHEVQIRCIGAGSPNYGGFYRIIRSKSNAVFLTKYVIKLPLGWRLHAYQNPLGVGGKDRFIGLQIGTGRYETYYRLTQCGETGVFSTFGHVAVSVSDNTKAQIPTATVPLVWYLAQLECYELTDYAEASPAVMEFISSAKSSLDSLATQNSSQAVLLQQLEASLTSKADATALNNLTTRVTSAEGTITTQGQQITSLSNSLPGKADAAALNNLATRVTSAEGKLTTQSTSVTQLSNSLTSLTGRVNVLDTEKIVLLDLLRLDTNVWYPVTLNLNSSAKRWSFRLYRSLSGNEAPHPIWSKHPSGFSLELIWSVMGSGWGSQDIERLVDAFQYLWMKDDLSPVMGPTQMTHSSTEVIYLRGGARYHLVTDKTVTPTVRTTLYANNGDSVSPRAYDVNLVPKTIAQTGKASADAVNTLTTTVNSLDGKLTAQSQQMTVLSSALADKANSSGVNTLATTVNALDGKVTAQATQVSLLITQAGSNQAAVQQTQKVVADLQGKLQAQAALKVQTSTSTGKPVITGITLNASPVAGSSVIIDANTFALISGLNGKVTTPFMVQNGQVVINEALFNNLILSASLHSVNYVPGKSGFNLDAKTGLLSIFGGVGATSTEISNGGFYVKEGQNYLVEIGLFKS